MEITIEKLVALAIAICFCIICWIHMWLSSALSQFFISPIVLLLPLALIWFDDLLGSISGFSSRSPGYMSESSPVAIRLLGWVFLLAMIGWMIYDMVTGSPWESRS